jgi:hypothetical protein
MGLLERLGVRSPDVRYLGWGFMAVLCSWLAFVAWRVRRAGGGPPRDPLARAYAQLCRKSARVAAARLPHQGPLAFCAQVTAARPDLQVPLAPLFEQYARLRYGRADPGWDARVDAFRRSVGRLKLPRQARAA